MISDFTLAENRQNPYPIYKSLREQSPLWQSPIYGHWVLSKYEDVKQAAKSKNLIMDQSGIPPRLVSEWRNKIELLQQITKTPFGSDGVMHDRMQQALVGALNRTRVAEERTKIRSLVNKIIDKHINNGTMDFVNDLAHPLTLCSVFSLVGINQDIIDHVAYNSVEVLGKNAIIKLLIPGMGSLTRDDVVQAVRTHSKLIEYAKLSIEENRLNPKDNLISVLLTAMDRNEITEEEMFSNLFAIQYTSLDGAPSLLGNTIIALDNSPQQKSLLVNNISLATETVKEVLRYDSSVLAFIRVVSEGFTIHDKTLPNGSIVIGLIGSANRDPDMFPNPDQFDILRENKNHLSFSTGVHKCLGAALITLIAEEMVTAVYSRLPGIRIKPGTVLEYTEPWMIRGVKSLPVVW